MTNMDKPCFYESPSGAFYTNVNNNKIYRSSLDFTKVKPDEQIFTGSQGGRYVLRNGKKVYISSLNSLANAIINKSSNSRRSASPVRNVNNTSSRTTRRSASPNRSRINTQNSSINRQQIASDDDNQLQRRLLLNRSQRGQMNDNMSKRSNTINSLSQRRQMNDNMSQRSNSINTVPQRNNNDYMSETILETEEEDGDNSLLRREDFHIEDVKTVLSEASAPKSLSQGMSTLNITDQLITNRRPSRLSTKLNI